MRARQALQKGGPVLPGGVFENDGVDRTTRIRLGSDHPREDHLLEKFALLGVCESGNILFKEILFAKTVYLF